MGTWGSTQSNRCVAVRLHAARDAGGAKPPALAGEGDQHLVAARGAAHAGKAVGEGAASEVALEPAGCTCVVTKRQTLDRRFVVAHPALLSLLRYAAEHALGQDLLFPPWTNVRRDLIEACTRAGIERCSPNDLRRTYGRWIRNAAFPDEIIAPMIRHADTSMLERVYGKLSSEELSRRLLLHVRAAVPDCIGNASLGTEIDGISRDAART